MVREMFGRTVMPTTLDPLPRSMRACPGYVVLNPREIREINQELAAKDLSGGTFKYIVGILQIEDELDQERIEAWRRSARGRGQSRSRRLRRRH